MFSCQLSTFSPPAAHYFDLILLSQRRFFSLNVWFEHLSTSRSSAQMPSDQETEKIFTSLTIDLVATCFSLLRRVWRWTMAALWADNIAANATKRYILAGPADTPRGLWVGQTMAAVFLPSAPAETAGKAAGMRRHLDLTLGKHVPRPLALRSRLNLFGSMNGRVINSSNAAHRVFMTSKYLLDSVWMAL